MAIIALAAASMLAFASVILQFLRVKTNPEIGQRAMPAWVAVVSLGIGLVFMLCALGLVIARFTELDGVTRLTGLAPAGLLLAVLFLSRTRN